MSVTRFTILAVMGAVGFWKGRGNGYDLMKKTGDDLMKKTGGDGVIGHTKPTRNYFDHPSLKMIDFTHSATGETGTKP